MTVAATGPGLALAPVLALDEVASGYGRLLAVADVSVEVPPSSVVALLGPNGAGKSTVLRTASGLVPARRGRVLLDGTDVTRLSPSRRTALGLCHVPEGRSVFRTMTVRENLDLFRPRRSPPAAADPMEIFPILRSRAGQVAGSLSGGEQQMLALARAYLSGARVVLLDEVSMGLAPKVVHEIFDSIRRLAATGVSLLIVEQYVRQALAMADHAYVMVQGRIVHHGAASDLDDGRLAELYLQGAGATGAVP
ncbi:MAG TPA: ABC transporter ATP-binding protein [Acidimicrobiales bacterium]|nr:ABC transporter ATP-binding protein [Acidimicrobiales bacterium]